MARSRRWVIDLRTRLALAIVIVGANAAGAVVVFALAGFVLPEGPLADPRYVHVLNATVFVGYVVLSSLIGLLWGARKLRVKLTGDELELRRERRMVLYGPLRIVMVEAALWIAAVLVFVTLNVHFSVRLAIMVGETIFLGGITTCALSYLLIERILRRSTARVLAEEPPPRRVLPGVMVRSLLFWALGTAVPVVGVITSAMFSLIHGDVPTAQLAFIVMSVGSVALVSGLIITIIAARAVADPVNAVRRGMRKIERGDLDGSVQVYDGTELGQLQSGFNTMVAGLRERERLRDLFGRHVGRDVAQAAAAADEVRLGGELRRVAVLFVDLVGSTALAAQRSPDEVVALLNRFFAVVVETVEEHEGWINKFEGDAALAVFGAPVGLADPAGCALAAARRLGERLADQLPDLDVGIGVSAGDAVAGNVGDLRRFEYTVIGDPVNEAARLTELAKTVPGRVLAAASAVELAAPAEKARWTLGDETVLRGRSDTTRLAVPRTHRAAPEPAAP